MSDNKKSNKFIPDNIVKVDSATTYNENMARYSLYVLFNRFVPDIRDGLKPVQRRILYTMWHDVGCVSRSTKRKSANTVGIVMALYHPHGDVAIYDSFKPMGNWYEIKVPLIEYDSNSGSIQGGPHAASRYTETFMSKFAYDYVIGELNETTAVTDWRTTFDNKTIEPEYLPVKVPLLLINGSFAIAIGRKIEIPRHSVNDVIDATIELIDNPNVKVVLIPDPCQKCEIINTDWKKICNTGFGPYIQRGIVETVTDPKSDMQYLAIRSVPDLVFSDSIMEKVEDLIKKNILVQIQDIQDHSTEEQLDIRLYLKKGSDADFVKQVLYKNTPLQSAKNVNFEVIDGNEIKRFSYKAYLLSFIENRRLCKFRLYNARLQKAETRLHQIDTYIKILESGDVENIIHMIRNQSSMDEAYLVDWLMKKLKITDLQAKFVLHTEIGRLSKGHLNKYKEEQKKLNEAVKSYINMITNEKLIDDEIKAELLECKAKYGRPRQSILISAADASDIPKGEFKLVVTEQNFIKKLQVNDPIRPFKGDNAKCIIVGENDKDVLLFDQMGKAFRLPIHKVAFTEKISPGIDIRLLIKKCTSNIISAMYIPIIEFLANKQTKSFFVSVTKQGLIKKIDLDDLINATTSGILYSKLNQGDSICDVLIANNKSDIIVYSKSKIIRIPMSCIPYLKRATLGNIAMKSNDPIEGMSVVTSGTKYIIIVTAKGRFNKVLTDVIVRSDKSKAGTKAIKLAKGDYIQSVFAISENAVGIKITRPDEVLTVDINSISNGSTVSQGEKMCKDGVIKAEIVYKEQ